MHHTPYASALKDQALACPACSGPLALDGERWPCQRCDGVFVETSALEQMMAEMRGVPWQMPSNGSAGTRACPACKQAMAVHRLDGIEVDRCAMHGVWFDSGELAYALHGKPPEKSWLRRLIG